MKSLIVVLAIAAYIGVSSAAPTVSVSSVDDQTTFVEGDTVSLTINLSKRDGENLYAFVEPLNADATNFLSGAQMISADGKATGKGVEIPGTGTMTPKTINLIVLDGPCEPKFQAILCSEETYDADKVVDRYTPVPVTIVCENVAPQGMSGNNGMRVGGYAVTNNAVLPAAIPAGNLISLGINIDDVAADRLLSTQPNEMLIDWIGGADPDAFTNGLFITKWNFFNANGKNVETRITVGSRNRQAVTNFTFTSIGTNRVEVQMLDKDMIKALLDGGVARDEIVKWSDGSAVVPYGDETGFWSTGIGDDDWGPKFVVYIPVEDKANVSIVPVNASSNAYGETGFFEGATAGGFDIFLSVPAPVPLTVKLWVERMARTDGVAQDIGTLGSLEIKNKELGMDTNEYVEVSFKRGVDMQHVNITGMDGTPYSSYRIHAVVTTTTTDGNDIPMNKFYDAGAYTFRVFNVKPALDSIDSEINGFDPSTGPSANVVMLTQDQPVSINWFVSDAVRIDETNNFTVTWSSSEPGSTMTTNNVTEGTYETKFSTAGEKTITLSINDKDGGINFYEWNFNVMTAIYTATVGDVVWVYENYGETDARITGSQTVLTGNVVIPDAVNGRTVVAIAESALKNASGVTGITIPKSVMLIEDGAFAGLEEVLAQWYKSLADLVEGGSAYGIGSEAADQTIAAITVDSDTTIGDFVLSKDKVYDSVIYIVNTADHEINITLPAGYTYKMFKGAKPLKVPANSESVLTITRLAENVFLVSAEELETMK